MAHIAACQVVSFQGITPNIQTRFHCRDAIVHNQTNRHFPQSHSNHLTQAHRRICDPCPEPETEKVEKNNRQHEREQRQHCDADKIKRFHIAAESIGTETTRKVLISWKALSSTRWRYEGGSTRWQIARGLRRIPVPSASIICHHLGEADPPVEGLVRESVSFLLALRRAFR